MSRAPQPMGNWRIDAVSRTDGSTPSFGFVITITNSDGKAVLFRAKDRWPATAGNLYIQRYTPDPERDVLTLVESFDLLSLKAVHGKRTAGGKSATTIDLSIDRPSRKHCSVLVTRQFAGNTLVKEVAYLRTEAGTKSHKSRFYLQPSSARTIAEIVVDTRETYAWAFKAARVTTAALRSGDYALRVDERILAVIERKTMPNMLANLSTLESYNAHLTELSSYLHGALVIEAQYRDFLDPVKTKPLAAARCARALADIGSRHPNLQVVFAGNRKTANTWAAHFFESCAALAAGTHAMDAPVQESLVDDHGRANTGGVDAEIRHAIMHVLPVGIRVGDLVAAFPTVPTTRLSRCLKALRGEGKLTTQGAGRTTVWIREALKVISP